jgi:hypothetical protein
MQPLAQLRPTPTAGSVTHCNGDCLLPPDQNDQPFATCHASVEKVPLQHGVMLGEHRDDHGRVFRSLAFVDGRGIGWHQQRWRCPIRNPINVHSADMPVGLEVSQRTEGDPKGRSCAQSHKFKAAARSALLFRKVATTGTGLFFGSSEVASTTSSAPYAHLLQHVTDGRRSARLGPPGELGCFAWTEGRQTAGPLPSPPRAVRILDPDQLAPSFGHWRIPGTDLERPFD